MSGKNVKVKIKVQPVVVMEAEVARKIRQHSRSSMKAEVCGVLIGSTDDDRTVIEACIAGINAAQGGAHVTFTQDTWEHIYKIKDQQYPDDKIVGWYHSHPGFGVFLSEHDLFIQENFFSSPQQVAWVYDPHTDEEGCFGWVGGKIEKLTGMRFGYSQSIEIDSSAANENEYDEDGDAGGMEMSKPVNRTPAKDRNDPAWVKWTNRVIVTISLLIVGFMAHDFLFMRVNSPAARAFQHQYEDALQQAQQQVEQRVQQQVEMVEQQLQRCGPEIRACQARLDATALGPVSPAAPAAGSPKKSPGQKGPGSAGKGNDGKH